MQDKGTILIIDDEEEMREIIESMLGGLGFSFSGVGCARDALEVTFRQKFALIICDYRMPDGMNGLQLFETLLATGNASPFILTTGVPDAEIGDQARRAGVFGFFPKPIDSSALRKLVQMLNFIA